MLNMSLILDESWYILTHSLFSISQILIVLSFEPLTKNRLDNLCKHVIVSSCAIILRCSSLSKLKTSIYLFIAMANSSSLIMVIKLIGLDNVSLFKHSPLFKSQMFTLKSSDELISRLLGKNLIIFTAPSCAIKLLMLSSSFMSHIFISESFEQLINKLFVIGSLSSSI